jgi:hypothetical protein
MNPENVAMFMKTMDFREDLFEPLGPDERKAIFGPDTMIIYGSHSSNTTSIEDAFARFNPARLSRIQVWGCGDLVHEEMPEKVVQPIVLFLEGLGIFFR